MMIVSDLKPKIKIVGAGFSGILAGIEFRKRGFDVTLFEKHNQISRQVCGEYLSPQGLKIFQELGLVRFLQFEKIWGMHLYAPSGLHVATTFPEKRWGLSINRLQLLKDLVDFFLQMGGEMLWGHDWVKQPQLEDGIVIGADGRQSRIARLAGLKENKKLKHRIALHTYLTPIKPLDRFGQMHLFANGSYIGINPITNTEVNVSLVLDVSEYKKFDTPKSCLEFYLNESSHLNHLFSLPFFEEVRAAYPISRQSLEISWENGCLLGDAAGFIDPLTGEGITSALKSVTCLMKYVDQYGLGPETFKHYEREWKSAFWQKEFLNLAFQKLLRTPQGMEILGLILSGSTNLSNTLIGVIGNIYTPFEAIRKMTLNYFQEKSL